jgi:dihydroorotase
VRLGLRGRLLGAGRPADAGRGLRTRGALDRLEGFASRNGAAFYGISPRIAGFPDRDVITLRKEAWRVPDRIGPYVPFRAGQEIGWRIVP